MTAVASTFSSDKTSLHDLLEDIRLCKVQLPDFQRDWIWDEERIRSLLASVSLSYPIGSVMLLETGNPEINFKPRPIEGVDAVGVKSPELLVLDGQQRLTALFQATKSNRPVVTKREERKRETNLRWYYIDINKAITRNGDREDAIFMVHEDKLRKDFRGQVLADYSSPEREYEQCVFPVNHVFSSSDWRMGFYEHWQFDKEKLLFFTEFEKDVLKRFEQYQIPTILLKRNTGKMAVCQVFEKVNTGGVPLNVFELLTATYAADNFNLRDDWTERMKRIRKPLLADRISALGDVENTDLLQTISLLVTHEKRLRAISEGTKTEDAPGIGCKRWDILKLSLADYQAWAEKATQGYETAGKFLAWQKVFTQRDIPYGKQVVPMAALLTLLGDEYEIGSVKSKIARWYWCGVLGEKYGSAIESLFAKDLPELLEWLNNGPEPSTVAESTFNPSRLLTLRTRNSAAYKGIYLLLMGDGCIDFWTGSPIDMQIFFDEDIDIHHIFPASWCDKNGIGKDVYNSIVNKTAISSSTNRRIGGRAPSEYLNLIQRGTKLPEETIDEILTSHLVSPPSIRSDDFETFFKDRAESILARIEKAMGKTIPRERDWLERSLGSSASETDSDDDSS